jgi:four helix bundle protein
MEIGDEVWGLVHPWGFFPKDTIGKQLVRAADSVAANISEGYGRYHTNDSKRFYYYARASLYETRTWLRKAHTRSLIDDEIHATLQSDIETLAVKLNKWIQVHKQRSSN